MIGLQRAAFVGAQSAPGCSGGELAVQGGVHGGDVSDVHTLGLSRFDHSGRFDRVTFVPPQEDGRGDKKYEAGDNSLQGVAEPAAVAVFLDHTGAADLVAVVFEMGVRHMDAVDQPVADPSAVNLRIA